MTLYKLSDEFIGVVEALEAAMDWEPRYNSDGQPINDDGEPIEDVEQFRAKFLTAWQDALNAVDENFDAKAGNIAAYIKKIKAECEMLNAEEKRLQQRRRSRERAVEQMTNYLMDEMIKTGKTKIDVVQAKISLRNNPESVMIADEKSFIEWAQTNRKDELLTYVAPKISKTAVKNEIKAGKELPGAVLQRTKSLMIK